jgi:hypothetical protein
MSVGSRCPHCGVLFTYDETNGRRMAGGSSATYGGGGGYFSFRIVRAVIALVSLIAALCGGAFAKSRM